MKIGIDARKLKDFGIGRYIRELLVAMVEVNPDADITAIVKPEDEDTTILPASIHRKPSPAGLYSVSEMVELSVLARLEEFDVYHAPHYVVPIGLPCPAVVTIHDLIHIKFASMFGRIKPMIARLLIQHAAQCEAVLTVSRTTAHDLVEIGGIDPGRIHVTPNAVTQRFYEEPPPADRQAIRERLGFAGPFILCVSNHRPHKNLPFLLSAFGRISTEYRLVVTSPFSAELDGLAEKHGFGDRFHMIGFVDEDQLPALYREAHIFAFPSLYEGFGLPVLEAAASGVPVVAVRAPYLDELMADAALYADSDKVAEFAAGMTRLIEDPDLHAVHAQMGRVQARKFSWEETARKTFEVYESVISGRWSRSVEKSF